MRIARLLPLRLFLLAAAFTAASSSPARAQVAAGEITGLVKDQAGAAVPGATANAFAGFGVERPNLVGDPALPADQPSPSRWFNTTAFAPPDPFTIGTASRNPVRGPSYRDVDLSLIRRIPIGGSRALEIRAEVFNLLNAMNLGAPNGVAGSASFGTITTALDPRVAQVAVKLLF